jgi:hypothetical protein
MWRLQVAMILLTRALKVDGAMLAKLDLDDDVKLAMVILDRCLKRAKAAGVLIDLAADGEQAAVAEPAAEDAA